MLLASTSTTLARLAALALLVSSATAESTTPYNVAAPGATPAFKIPKRPTFMSLDIITQTLNSTSIATRDFADEIAVDVVRRTKVDLFGSDSDSSLEERSNIEPRAKKYATRLQLAIASTCVGTGSNDTYISSLFYYGGAGTTVFLCQNAVIALAGPIFFSAANQTLATKGYPTGNARATVQVTAADQSCAIYGAVWGGDNISVRNIQVDGARPALGLIEGGSALIEFGGDNVGQIVDNVHVFEPRGWSCLHLIEGTNNDCSSISVTNNQVGPSGHAPSGPLQFRKRDNTGTYAPGQWADGISLACKGSTVTGNVITDATDGAIVVFGAPGSTIKGNTIISLNRQLLGGINMVDWAPFSGSFEGTVVTQNTIWARGNFIKIGIPMGGMTWGVDNRTVARTFGGTVTDNTFIATNGYFGYAMGAAGHDNAVVSGNNARKASFGSIESPACFSSDFPLPAPQAFIRDPNTTPGSWQDGFYSLATLVLLICRGPGAVTARGSPY